MHIHMVPSSEKLCTFYWLAQWLLHIYQLLKHVDQQVSNWLVVWPANCITGRIGGFFFTVFSLYSCCEFLLTNRNSTGFLYSHNFHMRVNHSYFFCEVPGQVFHSSFLLFCIDMCSIVTILGIILCLFIYSASIFSHFVLFFSLS